MPKRTNLKELAPVEKEDTSIPESKEAMQSLKEAVTMSEEAFTKALTDTRTKAESVQTDYQALALSALLDCSTNKNANRVNALIASMPDSVRKNSMRAFVEKYGAVKWDKGSKAFAYDKTRKLNLWGANQKPWHSMKPEGEYKPFDFFEQVQVLLQRAGKKLESKKEGDKVTPEMVNQLGAFVAQMKLQQQDA